jgi:hypothetical protein
VAILLTQQKVGLATTPTLELVTILTNPLPHPNTPIMNALKEVYQYIQQPQITQLITSYQNTSC